MVRNAQRCNSGTRRGGSLRLNSAASQHPPQHKRAGHIERTERHKQRVIAIGICALADHQGEQHAADPGDRPRHSGRSAHRLAVEHVGAKCKQRTVANAHVRADENVRTYLEQTTPMRRFGVPADFAGVAVSLASPQMGYVTGQVIEVAGGMSL